MGKSKLGLLKSSLKGKLFKGQFINVDCVDSKIVNDFIFSSFT